MHEQVWSLNSYFLFLYSYIPFNSKGFQGVKMWQWLHNKSYMHWAHSKRIIIIHRKFIFHTLSRFIWIKWLPNYNVNFFYIFGFQLLLIIISFKSFFKLCIISSKNYIYVTILQFYADLKLSPNFSFILITGQWFYFTLNCLVGRC